ncbi:MAG: hypothetical protein HOI45_04375 [Rhodospirillaceae bacterium]|jgi:hypothetical protein|nr:hypothetical protein [Rhodospirillaceae bacterium]
MGNQSQIRTHYLSEVGNSIKCVRAKYTKPFGNKLRTVKGRHCVDLVRTAYQGLLKGHINRGEFDRVVIAASFIIEVCPDVLLAHFLLLNAEKQLSDLAWFNPELKGGASWQA